MQAVIINSGNITKRDNLILFIINGKTTTPPI